MAVAVTLSGMYSPASLDRAQRILGRWLPSDIARLTVQEAIRTDFRGWRRLRSLFENRRVERTEAAILDLAAALGRLAARR